MHPGRTWACRRAYLAVDLPPDILICQALQGCLHTSDTDKGVATGTALAMLQDSTYICLWGFQVVPACRAVEAPWSVGSPEATFVWCLLKQGRFVRQNTIPQ
jgi:hypothetical protein